MNSGGSSSKSPKMPNPSGPVAPYGQTSDFSPSWVSFLPDEMGEDGRLPMARGLDESHLAAIRNRPAPPPLSGQQEPQQDLKSILAEMMADKRMAAFRRMREDPDRFAEGGGGPNRGGYTSSGYGR